MDAINASVPASAAASVAIVRFRPTIGVTAATLPSLVGELLLPSASWQLTLRDGPPGTRRDLSYAVLPSAAVPAVRSGAVELRA